MTAAEQCAANGGTWNGSECLANSPGVSAASNPSLYNPNTGLPWSVSPIDFNDSLQVTQAILAGNPAAAAVGKAYDKAVLSGPTSAIPAVVSQAGWDPYLTYLAATENPGGILPNGTFTDALIGSQAILPNPATVVPRYDPSSGITPAAGVAPTENSPSNTAFQTPQGSPSSGASASGVSATGVTSRSGTITNSLSRPGAASASGPTPTQSGISPMVLVLAGVVILLVVMKG